MGKTVKNICIAAAFSLYSTSAGAIVPIAAAGIAAVYAAYASTAMIAIAKYKERRAAAKLKPNFVRDPQEDVVSADGRTAGYGSLAEKHFAPGVPIACVPETFDGRDPAGRYLNRCSDGLGRTIGIEGEQVEIPNFSDLVRFGLITKSVVKAGSTCSNDTFGGDPLPDTGKSCYIHGFKIADEGGTINF
jgi:hypothetical protein